MDINKPMCYNCRHRGPVHNSRHSSCHHPRVQDIMSRSGDLLMLMDGIVNKRRIPYLFEDLKVVFAERGIIGGWALWPFNFDPLWLEQCSGFEEAK